MDIDKVITLRQALEQVPEGVYLLSTSGVKSAEWWKNLICDEDLRQLVLVTEKGIFSFNGDSTPEEALVWKFVDGDGNTTEEMYDSIRKGK